MVSVYSVWKHGNHQNVDRDHRGIFGLRGPKGEHPWGVRISGKPQMEKFWDFYPVRIYKIWSNSPAVVWNVSDKLFRTGKYFEHNIILQKQSMCLCFIVIIFIPASVTICVDGGANELRKICVENGKYAPVTVTCSTLAPLRSSS